MPAGHHSATLQVRAVPVDTACPPPGSAPVLEVNSGAFPIPLWYDAILNYSTLSGIGGATIAFLFTAPEPVFNLEIRGIQLDGTASVELESMSLTRTP